MKETWNAIAIDKISRVRPCNLFLPFFSEKEINKIWGLLYAHVHQTTLEFGKNKITKYLFWLLESNNTPSVHNMNTMLWINHCQNITPPYYTLCNNIYIFFLTMNVYDLQIKTQMIMGRKGTKTIAKHHIY